MFAITKYCRPVDSFRFFGGSRMAGQHNCLLVLYVAQGQAFVAGRVTRNLSAGEFLLAEGDVRLTAHAACEILGSCLSGLVPQEFAAQSPFYTLLPAGRCPGAAALLQRLADDADSLAPGEASALAYDLLGRLAAAQQAGSTLPPLVATAVDEIHSHYAELYGIEELAAGLEVSKNHLIRRFTSAMGISPGKYLTRVRVDAAKHHLLQPGLTLEAIAGLCGFSGANYLCKVFRAQTGETPAAWRQRATATAVPSLPFAKTAIDDTLFL